MLTAGGCKARRKRLAEALDGLGAEGALITGRDHVFYFTGWHAKWCHAAAAYVDSEGRTTLVGAEAQEATGADETIAYASNTLSTMFSEQARRCAEKLAHCSMVALMYRSKTSKLWHIRRCDTAY